METGLEGKPWYVGFAIGLGIGALVLGLCVWQLFEPIRKEIRAERQKIKALEDKIREGLIVKADLPRLREEYESRVEDLEELRKILPSDRRTDDLIRKFRGLTEQAGFRLKVFDPAEKETDREFYREWPIKMDLDGGYHELALFFDRVSRFDRIINIENLKIASKQSGSHSISAQFTAKAFVYREEEPEDTTAKKPKKKGR